MKITAKERWGQYQQSLGELSPSVRRRLLRSPFDADDHSRGKALAMAPRWVVRRVETVCLRDATQVVRQISVDYEVPSGADGAVPSHLPLLLLGKVPPVMNIDLRDGNGASVSLLNRRENAELSAAALASALEHTLIIGARETFLPVCRDLALKQPAEALKAMRELTTLIVEHRQPIKNESTYRAALRLQRLMLVARSMVGNSIIWIANTHPPGSRCIVKLAYEQPIEVLASLPIRIGMFFGLRSLRLAFSTPHLRASQTYHFELSLPEEVQIRDERLDADIRDVADIERRRYPTFLKTFQNDVHLYFDLNGTQTLLSGQMSVKARASRRGFLSFALTASMLISSMLWAGWALRDHLASDTASHAIPPVLLVIPAVLLALISRPGEHPFSSFVLTGQRYIALANGILASIDAATLGFVADPSTSQALANVWLATAVASSLLTLVLLMSWIASLPGRARAAIYGSIAAIASGAVLILGAGLPGRWNYLWPIFLVSVPVMAYCALAVIRRSESPPEVRQYFASELEASGVLPAADSVVT